MAALLWGIGTILIKRLRSTTRVDLLALTTWQMILGAIPLVLLAVVVPERPSAWPLSYLGILAFMSIAGTALGWWLWIYILDRVPAWEAKLARTAATHSQTQFANLFQATQYIA